VLGAPPRSEPKNSSVTMTFNLSNSVMRRRLGDLFAGSELCKMKVLASALTCMLMGAVNAEAQQYDYVTSLQPSLTNSVVTIKASKAPLIYYSCYNPNGSDVFVQLFDKADAAAATLGRTVASRVLISPALSDTGPQQLTPPFIAKNGLQVAATTTSNGSIAPSGPIDCEFAYR